MGSTLTLRRSGRSTLLTAAALYTCCSHAARGLGHEQFVPKPDVQLSALSFSFSAMPGRILRLPLLPFACALATAAAKAFVA